MISSILNSHGVRLSQTNLGWAHRGDGLDSHSQNPIENIGRINFHNNFWSSPFPSYFHALHKGLQLNTVNISVPHTTRESLPPSSIAISCNTPYIAFCSSHKTLASELILVQPISGLTHFWHPNEIRKSIPLCLLSFFQKRKMKSFSKIPNKTQNSVSRHVNVI